jgi:hypothetical protein
MEFLDGMNELGCCNNRITIEISQTEVPNMQWLELE